MYTIYIHRAGDVQGEPRKGERTLAGVLFTGTFIERGIIMIERSGTRFNKGDYFETVIDTEIPSCEITGFIDGQPVDFSGGSLTIKTSHAVLSQVGTSITFENISHEPQFIALLADEFTSDSSDYATYVASYIKGDGIEAKRSFIRSVGGYNTANFNINTSFDNNILSFNLVGPFRFYTGEGYTLIYG